MNNHSKKYAMLRTKVRTIEPPFKHNADGHARHGDASSALPHRRCVLGRGHLFDQLCLRGAQTALDSRRVAKLKPIPCDNFQ